ncbi:hypothetical protein AB1I63_00930 [Streptococcus pneumoniae]
MSRKFLPSNLQCDTIEKLVTIKRMLRNELGTEAAVVSQMLSKLVTDNVLLLQDQNTYQEKYQKLVSKYDLLISELESVKI